jgi:hypothetical protein
MQAGGLSALSPSSILLTLYHSSRPIKGAGCWKTKQRFGIYGAELSLFATLLIILALVNTSIGGS